MHFSHSFCCTAVPSHFGTALSERFLPYLPAQGAVCTISHICPKWVSAAKMFKSQSHSRDWPMKSIPAKQIGHTWLHKVGIFKKLAVNSITLSTWPPFSLGCQFDQCYQYGRQLNQRWYIHIMACDPFVIRLSSWTMLSIWPPTKPTMTYSYNGLWPIRHQAVILTSAVNMAAN